MKKGDGSIFTMDQTPFFTFGNCYNITEILNVYYNFVKTLDNRQKKNKIVV